MAAAQATRDLRSDAIDSKRVQDHNSKWDPAFSRGIDIAPSPFQNRIHPPPSGLTIKANQQRRHAYEKKNKAENRVRKLDRLGTDEEEALDKPDMEGAFDGTPRSYDSVEGPTAGQQLLGIAVNKAIARFEDKQTTKLVKDEYDVLDAADSDKEEDDRHKSVEDDFELV